MQKESVGLPAFNLTALLDYFIIPLFLILAVYDLNFVRGFIDYFEAGKELACVNELFRGKVLYRDIYSHFGPLNIYLEAWALLIFGKSLAVLRAYFYIGTISTLIIFYLISLKLCRSRVFAYASAFFLAVETFHPFWSSRWGGFRFTAGALAVLFAINFFQSGKGRWLLLSGLFSGVSFLITFDVGILSCVAVGSGLFLFVLIKHFNGEAIPLKSLALFVTGTLCVMVPFLVYFLSIGALFPYLNTLITTAKCQGGTWAIPDLDLRDYLYFSKILSCDFKYVISLSIYAVIALVIARRIRTKKVSWVDYAILSLMAYGFLMLIVKVTAKRLLMGPQFQMAFQPAVVLGFVFIDILSERIRALRKYGSAGRDMFKLVSLIIIFSISVSYFLFSDKRFYGSLISWGFYETNKNCFMPIYSGGIPLSKMSLSTLTIDRAKGVIVPSDQAGEIEGVVKYMISKTRSNEPVFSFPEHGIFNFFIDRPCVDRFTIPGFALVPGEWRRELLVDLEKVKPKYAIYSRRLSNLAMAANRDQEILPEIAQYIFTYYHKEASFGLIDVWRRNNS